MSPSLHQHCFSAGAVREPLLRRDGGDGGGVVGQAGGAQAQDWQAHQVCPILVNVMKVVILAVYQVRPLLHESL